MEPEVFPDVKGAEHAAQAKEKDRRRRRTGGREGQAAEVPTVSSVACTLASSTGNLLIAWWCALRARAIRRRWLGYKKKENTPNNHKPSGQSNQQFDGGTGFATSDACLAMLPTDACGFVVQQKCFIVLVN